MASWTGAMAWRLDWSHGMAAGMALAERLDWSPWHGG
jgi:hypothetical protein